MAVTDITKTAAPEHIQKAAEKTVQNITFHQITIDEYLLAKEEIKYRLEGIADNFTAIGFRLRQIRDSEAYRQEGYKSISEFAEKEFGIKESVTSRLIKINETFSEGGYSDRLKPEYKNYGASLLYEMTQITEEDRRLIVAGTTVASIRELKKFNRDAEEHTDNKTDAPVKADIGTTETKAVPKTKAVPETKAEHETKTVSETKAVPETEVTSETKAEDKKPENDRTEAGETPYIIEENSREAYGTTETVTAEILSVMPAACSDLETVIIEFFRNERELLNEIYQMSDYEGIADRINPSGSRTFRKNIYMLFMYGYGEGLILKKMGEENKSYTWQQFIETTVAIYRDTYTDHDTVWENFYNPSDDKVNKSTAEETEKVINEAAGSSGTPATSQESRILSLRKWYTVNKNMSLDMGVKHELTDRLLINLTPEATEKIAEFIEELTVEYTAYVYKNMGGEV